MLHLGHDIPALSSPVILIWAWMLRRDHGICDSGGLETVPPTFSISMFLLQQRTCQKRRRQQQQQHHHHTTNKPSAAYGVLTGLPPLFLSPSFVSDISCLVFLANIFDLRSIFFAIPTRRPGMICVYHHILGDDTRSGGKERAGGSRGSRKGEGGKQGCHGYRGLGTAALSCLATHWRQRRNILLYNLIPKTICLRRPGFGFLAPVYVGVVGIVC